MNTQTGNQDQEKNLESQWTRTRIGDSRINSAVRGSLTKGMFHEVQVKISWRLQLGAERKLTGLFKKSLVSYKTIL